jgi:hypothetical protein
VLADIQYKKITGQVKSIEQQRKKMLIALQWAPIAGKKSQDFKVSDIFD